MTSTTGLDTATVLAAARRLRTQAEQAEVGVMRQALEWCRIHQVVDEDDAATWGNTPLPLAGPGAPMVGEFCIAEFGTALRVSTDSARSLLAHALELGHRLPRIWARVQDGDLPVWRARRIAEQTIPLTAEAAEYVDTQLAPFAPKTGPAATERLVNEAIGRFMPETAAELARESADGRYVRVEHDQLTFTGTSSLYASIDLADAIDLEQALQTGAETLKALGSDDSLDVRRAITLGDLARGTTTLPLDTPALSVVEEVAQQPSRNPRRSPRRRDLTIYLHLSPDCDLVRVENAGGHLITKEQLALWTGTGDANVTIKPIIDLNKPISTSAYEIPSSLREQVILRDGVCAFPYCTRPARSCDLDHITPYDPDGPPDQTSSDNLAPLCRRHHRLKTLADWTYTRIEPGLYLWRSPHGYAYLTDQQGTQELTPRPVEPPDG